MEIDQNHKSNKKKLFMDDEVLILEKSEETDDCLLLNNSEIEQQIEKPVSSESSCENENSKDVIVLDTKVEIDQDAGATNVLDSNIANTNTEAEIILDINQDSSMNVCNNDPGNTSKEIPSNLDSTVPSGVASADYCIVDECDTKNENIVENVQTEPLLTISFRDSNVLRQYEDSIKTFLKDLIGKSVKGCCTKRTNLGLEIWDGKITKNSKVSLDNMEGEPSDESLFTIDTQPSLKNDLDVPTYGKKFDLILEKPSTKQEESKNDCVMKVTCFNCMGNHSLRDCTEPRNYTNISKNRKGFNMKMIQKNTRYHQDEDQKFGHLVPGQLSKNLRHALNLKDNELPKHIYKMRILGYPPGWLEEARLQHSGLCLFNSDGVAENEPEDEDGEIVCIENKDKYDIKKIIDFPGFNVRPPRSTYDECKQYWGSEMQIMNSKSVMLSKFSNRKVDEGYKRKKLKKSVPTTPDTKVVPSEMEIDEIEDVVVESVSVNGLFVPPLPKEDIRQPDPPPPPPSEDSDSHSQEPLSPDSANESTAPSSRADSPSLSDLEFTKKHILAELEDSSSQSNSETPGKCEMLDTNSPNAEMPPPVGELTPHSNRIQSKQNTPTSNHGSVKSVDFGTPILKSASPYNALPSSEKFSKNICDVIYFENLPDSTGKYEQMSGIIQKVRDRLAHLHKE